MEELYLPLNIQRFATHLQTWETYYLYSGTGTPRAKGDAKGRVVVSLVSQNISNNTSYISIQHQIVVTGMTMYSWNYNTSSYRANQGSRGGSYQTINLPAKEYSVGTHTLGTTYHTVYHNADGTGQLYVNGTLNASGGVQWGSETVTKTSRSLSFNVGLPTIPRATSITSMTTSNITFNSVKVNWSTADNVSQVYASVGTSGWVSNWTGNAKSGSFTIGSLTPNTTHTLGIKVIRADSGEPTEKWASFKTLDIARLKNVPATANADNDFTIEFDRNGADNVNIEIRTAGETVVIPYQIATGSSFTFSTSTYKNIFYNNMATVKSKTYRVYLNTNNGAYESSFKTFIMYVTNANPIFNDFTYANTDKILPKGMNERTLTGSATKFIKGYSDIVATITGGNLATAQKGASMKEYKLDVQGMSVVTKATSSNVVITKENITNSLVKVLAVDTRENNTAVSKTVDMIDYNPIKIDNVIVERQDGGVSGIVKLSFNGTWCDCNFGAMANTIDAIYEYKLPSQSENEWEVGLTDVVVNKLGNNFSVSDLTIKGDKNSSGFTVGQSFDIRITVTDQVERFSFRTILGSGTPNIAMHKDGTAIGGMYDTGLDKGIQLYGDNIYVNGIPLIEWEEV